MKVDWSEIEHEYVTSEASYRDLSAKYGVSKNFICRRSMADGWREKKEEYFRGLADKKIELTKQHNISRFMRIQGITDRLLDVVEDILSSKEPIPPNLIRSLSGAIKDIREVQGAKSDLGLEEQQARMAALRRQAAEKESVTEVYVTFGGESEGWGG